MQRILISITYFIYIISLMSLASCGNAFTDFFKKPEGKAFNNIGKIKDLPIERAGINVDYCTKDTDSTAKIKTLFIVDRSASNQSVPTDIDRDRRYGGVQNYLAQNPSKENQYFGIIEFFCGGYQNSGAGCRGGSPGGSGAEIPDPNSVPDGQGGVYIPTQNNGSIFMQNMSSQFSQVVDTLKNTADPQSSGTPYNKPIVTAYAKIVEDIDLERKQWKERVDAGEVDLPLPRIYYRIVMVTDGVMTDVGQNTAEQYIFQKIDDLINIPGKAKYSDIAKEVRFSTAFYNISTVPSNLRQFAEGILQEMANRGKGKFISLINGEQIDFKLLLFSPTVYVDTIVAHLFIYNENVIWNFKDLELSEDRDADRVPDSYEKANYPNCVGKKDCDDNGYSDGVEKEVFGNICVLNSNNFCDPILKQVENCDILDTNGKPSDTDRDGINDCEEILLGSDNRLFDTRGHDVSDGLSFYAGVPFVKEEGQSSNNSKTSQKDLDSDLDGISNYDEIKQNLPVEIPNNYFSVLKPTKYVNLPLKVTDRPDSVCYTTTVTDLPVKSLTDLVSVELILKEKTAGGKNYFKKVSKNLVNGSVVFTVEDMRIK